MKLPYQCNKIHGVTLDQSAALLYIVPWISDRIWRGCYSTAGRSVTPDDKFGPYMMGEKFENINRLKTEEENKGCVVTGTTQELHRNKTI